MRKGQPLQQPEGTQEGSEASKACIACTMRMHWPQGQDHCSRSSSPFHTLSLSLSLSDCDLNILGTILLHTEHSALKRPEGPCQILYMSDGLVAQPAALQTSASLSSLPSSVKTSAPGVPCGRAASSPLPSVNLANPPKRRRVAKQNFDCFVVYDFEATCERLPNQIKPQELIEFSCVILDAVSLELGAQFQEYVRPTEHRLLTTFCVDLTGITQDRYSAASSSYQQVHWQLFLQCAMHEDFKRLCVSAHI